MIVTADLHIHSALSPCGSLEMSPRGVVVRARDLGLDMIAVTDHNSMANVDATVEAGNRDGVVVIPGMEAQTAEGVHVLCYFPDCEIAQACYREIYPHLPDIANNADFFGDQVIVDIDDNVTGFEPRVLLNSLDLSIDELVLRVRAIGGEVIPAHVESNGFGLLPHLGMVPPHLDLSVLEIAWPHTREEVLREHPDLASFSLVSHSDAHYLRDIGRAAMRIEIAECRFSALFAAYRRGSGKVLYRQREDS
ncbi:MAG TPA: PHP domain-containing protein [Candidatus Aminicenantes bacterium]|nr:PHP domain-containing protein [Candidatus Aminicenantes bacterium]